MLPKAHITQRLAARVGRETARTDSAQPSGSNESSSKGRPCASFSNQTHEVVEASRAVTQYVADEEILIGEHVLVVKAR